ncbi:MFS transporter [Zafaria sp. J156]|uniref:MFS transporter n=1 Tax=Zafaria sp. J156 TaxID=3116490 RepID=UPI002E764A79|nr:MFS transporter [Zafaria sp. J156]MEE1621986.1 MFS transporter [Zafaria sp. J156]
MNFVRYAHLLRQPGVAWLLAAGMVARFPHSAAGILLTLHVVQTLGREWTAAGTVAALMTVGIALGAPWRGRQVDTHGLRRALLPSVLVEGAVWTAAPHVSYEWLLLLAFVGGVFAVPVFSVVRQALGVMTAGDTRRSAFALDSIATELVFMCGPALAAVIATSASTRLGLTGVGIAAALSGLVLMWLNPPTRSGQPGAVVPSEPAEERKGAEASVVAAAPLHLAEAEAELIPAGLKETRRRIQQRGRGFRHRFAWVTAGVVGVFLAASGAGLVLAGSEVAVVAVLQGMDRVAELGIVFVFWCGASLVGGLVYGALPFRLPPLVLLLAMSVLSVPLLFAQDTLTLALLTVGPGLLCAPVLASASERLTELVREERRGEAMGWYGSALTGGTALGSPLVGLAIDNGSTAAAFVLIGVAGSLLSLAALTAQLLRRRRRGRGQRILA